MAKQTTPLDPNSMAPTSELPFAARQCDVAYIGLIKNGSQHSIDKMADHIGHDSPAVQYAGLTNHQNLQLSRWVDVLKCVEQNLDWAHCGGGPNGEMASSCFMRAQSMLDLAVGQLELMADQGTSYLDDFCGTLATEKATK